MSQHLDSMPSMSEFIQAISTLNGKTTVKSLGSSDNLNDLYGASATGYYYITTGVTNAPTGGNWSQLFVIGGSITTQIVYSSARMWLRAYTGNPLAWTAWQEFALKSDVAAINTRRSTILNSTNITSDTTILGLENGAYQVSGSGDVAPYLPSKYGTLYVAKSANNYGMFIFIGTSSKIWVRSMANATTWHTEWQQLALKSDVTFTVASGSIKMGESISASGELLGGALRIQTTATANAWVTLGTISVKPTINVTVPCVRPGNGTYAGIVTIESSTGKVNLYPNSDLSNHEVCFSFSYKF